MQSFQEMAQKPHIPVGPGHWQCWSPLQHLPCLYMYHGHRVQLPSSPLLYAHPCRIYSEALCTFVLTPKPRAPKLSAVGCWVICSECIFSDLVPNNFSGMKRYLAKYNIWSKNPIPLTVNVYSFHYQTLQLGVSKLRKCALAMRSHVLGRVPSYARTLPSPLTPMWQCSRNRRYIAECRSWCTNDYSWLSPPLTFVSHWHRVPSKDNPGKARYVCKWAWSGKSALCANLSQTSGKTPTQFTGLGQCISNYGTSKDREQGNPRHC